MDLAGAANVITPLGTLLTAGVRLSVDGGRERVYPFTTCDRQGCLAQLGFTEEEMGQFRRGAKARLVVVPFEAPDQPAELTMSLSGFTAGMAAVEVEG